MKTQNPFAEISVNEIMTSEVQSVRAHDTIREAVGMMVENRLTTVPVVDIANNCIGMLSRSDLTEHFLQEDSELARMDTQGPSMEWLYRTLDTSDARLVQEFMTGDVTTVRENQTVAETCQVMVRHEIHHVPVVNDQQQVRGIVSAFDIVRAIAAT